jgi:hypothetical protein
MADIVNNRASAMRYGSTRSTKSSLTTKTVVNERARASQDAPRKERVSFDIPRATLDADILERPSYMGVRRPARAFSVYSAGSGTVRGSGCTLEGVEEEEFNVVVGIREDGVDKRASIASSAASWSEYLK